MADFHAVLQRTISALPENTGEARRAVYDRARQALIRQLQTLDPPLSPSEITRQRLDLEESIRKVEAEFAALMFSSPPFGDDDQAAGAEDKSPPPEEKPVPVPPPVEGKSAPPAPEKASAGPDETKPKDTAKPADQAKGADAEKAPENDETLKPKSTPKLDAAERPAPPQPKKRGGLIAGLVVLLLAGVAGAAIYSQRDALFSGGDSSETVIAVTPEEVDGQQAAEGGVETEPKGSDRVDETAPESASGSENGELTLERQGEEGQPRVILPQGPTPAVTPEQNAELEEQAAEETETAPAEEDVAAAPPADDSSLQPADTGDSRAFLYEAGSDPAAEGRASAGEIRWSLVQDGGIDDASAGPLIRADMSFPERGIGGTISIRKNADPTLPASYLFEFVFDVTRGFEGEGIAGVPGILLKGQEQEPGQPLSGAPAKIAENFYWFALTNSSAENQANIGLLRDESWFDILLFYDSGLRAVMSLSKGEEGARVFREAFAAWEG